MSFISICNVNRLPFNVPVLTQCVAHEMADVPRNILSLDVIRQLQAVTEEDDPTVRVSSYKYDWWKFNNEGDIEVFNMNTVMCCLEHHHNVTSKVVPRYLATGKYSMDSSTPLGPGAFAAPEESAIVSVIAAMFQYNPPTATLLAPPWTITRQERRGVVPAEYSGNTQDPTYGMELLDDGSIANSHGDRTRDRLPRVAMPYVGNDTDPAFCMELSDNEGQLALSTRLDLMLASLTSPERIPQHPGIIANEPTPASYPSNELNPAYGGLYTPPPFPLGVHWTPVRLGGLQWSLSGLQPDFDPSQISDFGWSSPPIVQVESTGHPLDSVQSTESPQT
ncbi:hypothetical protein DXG01_006373, partial [Tephrocybe rancida]